MFVFLALVLVNDNNPAIKYHEPYNVYKNDF